MQRIDEFLQYTISLKGFSSFFDPFQNFNGKHHGSGYTRSARSDQQG